MKSCNNDTHQTNVADTSVDYVCPMCPGVGSSQQGPCVKCGMDLEPLLPGSVYTCPMHPQVRSNSPGACPVCGMDLEPVSAPTDDSALKSMWRHFMAAASLSLPVITLAMWPMMPFVKPLPVQLATLSPWIQLACASLVVFWAGWPILKRGWASLAGGSMNMFTLVTLGIGTSYAFSVAVLLWPGLMPVAGHGHHHVGLYFETAAALTALVLLGQVLELSARRSTGNAIRSLFGLVPPMARKIFPDGDKDVPLSSIRVGDALRILPGARVPVDGIVVEGQTDVDESMMTGEMMRVVKHAGDGLIGGTMNGTGTCVLQATRLGADSYLGRVIEAVAAAQRSSPPVQQMVDRVSSIFVPVVIGIAALAFIAWLLWGPEPAINHALVAAVSVLIIACPCALGLATPMSTMVALGLGARHGVLFRSADAMQRLASIDIVVFDKTGTLTTGRPEVIAIEQESGFSAADVLKSTASLEQYSQHPLAGAIIRAAKSAGIVPLPAEELVETPGLGLQAKISGSLYTAGRNPGTDSRTADKPNTHPAASVVHVTKDGQPIGRIYVADTPKPEAMASVNQLKSLGIKLRILSGDLPGAVAMVAGHVGIRDYEGGLTPLDKARRIRELRSEGNAVAMAGDGVNDAPALAEAAVGIAMGDGTDVAIQTADIALLRGDLAALVRAESLSRATMRNIRQNLILAFGYNILAIPLAAGVLYPILGVTLNPVVAAAAMALSSVSVITNSLRLRSIQL